MWRRRSGAAVALLVLSLGCAGRFDVERLRGALSRPDAPSAPRLAAEETADLPGPEGLRALSGELRRVPLKWDPLLAGDVAGYLVERARPEGGFERVAAVPGRFGTEFLDRGQRFVPGDPDPARLDLADGTSYRYRVRAFDSEGRASQHASAEVDAETAAAPEPPRWLRAYSHLPRRVALTWKHSDDRHAAGYVIERSPSRRGPFDPVARTQGRFATVWMDRGLGDLRLFYYRVRAVNAAGGEGEATELVRAVTKPEPLPPLDLRIEAQALGENRLAWEPNVERDLLGYRVERVRASAEAPERVAELDATATAVTDAGVGAGEMVSYRVLALDRDGLESAPATLEDVRAPDYGLETRVTTEGVTLAWTPRSDEGWTRARVYRVGALRRREIGRTQDDRFVDADVEAGGRYHHLVVLEDEDGRRAPTSRTVETRVPEDWEAGAASLAGSSSAR